MRVRAMVATLALGALLVAGSALPSLAGNNDVIRRGACSGVSDWKLKLSPENGRIEVEYEVDQNRTGDAWRVRIRHDGDLVFAGTRTTHGAERFVRRFGSCSATGPVTTCSADAP